MKSKSDKKKELRERNKIIKKSLEKKCFGENKATDTIFGIRQSKASYKKSRSIQYFESKENSIKRMIGIAIYIF